MSTRLQTGAIYLTRILERAQAKWPEIRDRLAASFGDHPELADENANFAEAALAALAIGLQTLEHLVDPDRGAKLRSAVHAQIVERFGSEEAVEAVTLYEDLWLRTRDPRGLGLGFIMRILGEDATPPANDDQLIRYRTETIVGSAIVDTSLGVWEELLNRRGE